MSHAKALLATIIVLLGFPVKSFAWGYEAHQIIAEIAEQWKFQTTPVCGLTLATASGFGAIPVSLADDVLWYFSRAGRRSPGIAR